MCVFAMGSHALQPPSPAAAAVGAPGGGVAVAARGPVVAWAVGPQPQERVPGGWERVLTHPLGLRRAGPHSLNLAAQTARLTLLQGGPAVGSC